MGRLIFRLLGTPEVSHAEQSLTFQTRKVLALLAYLAVERGVHSRDKITALLWPESDEERGKASLRRALAYLRESLDEPSHERSGHVPLQPPHVLIEHHTLSFNLASDFEGDTHRGLLQETGGRCFFTHDSIRAGVYAEAGGIRRRVLHRRALETLQAASASPAELAHHALAAGLLDAAAHWSIAAGDAAMRVFAARDAIAQYEQARQLVRQSNEDPQPSEMENAVVSRADLSQLHLQLGWAYELSSQFAQAESIYEELLTLARALHELVMECAALNRLATQAAENRLDLARAEELLQQALAIAESSQNKAGEAETSWNLAQTGFYAAKMSASLPHAERALALARELNQQELVGRSLHALATLESALGKPQESLSHTQEARILAAIAHLQEAARCAEEVGLPGELWLMYVELGEMYRKQGDESQADQTFVRAAEIIHSLAGTMEDQQQRITFLSAPLVKRVLEHARFL